MHDITAIKFKTKNNVLLTRYLLTCQESRCCHSWPWSAGTPRIQTRLSCQPRTTEARAAARPAACPSAVPSSTWPPQCTHWSCCGNPCGHERSNPNKPSLLRTAGLGSAPAGTRGPRPRTRTDSGTRPAPDFCTAAWCQWPASASGPPSPLLRLLRWAGTCARSWSARTCSRCSTCSRSSRRRSWPRRCRCSDPGRRTCVARWFRIFAWSEARICSAFRSVWRTCCPRRFATCRPTPRCRPRWRRRSSSGLRAALRLSSTSPRHQRGGLSAKIKRFVS